MSSLTSSEQSRGTPLGFSEDSGGASVLTDAWPADSKTDAWPADLEGAVLTPGGGRGAGVRSGAGGGEGGTDVGALDSFPILIVRPQSTAGWEAAQYSHSPTCSPRPPGCRSCGRAGTWAQELCVRCCRSRGISLRTRILLRFNLARLTKKCTSGAVQDLSGKEVYRRLSAYERI